MSKYVILIKYHETSPYSGSKDRDHYALFKHTSTKYANNEPYFASGLLWHHTKLHTIAKSVVPYWLKIAQNLRTECKQNKQSKYGHIFVLKLNSPKLKYILEYDKGNIND